MLKKLMWLITTLYNKHNIQYKFIEEYVLINYKYVELEESCVEIKLILIRQ